MKGRKSPLTLVPPAGGVVPRPSGLKKAGRAGEIWDRLAPLVPNLLDGHELVLEDFCRVLALLETERDLLDEEGTVLGGKKNPRMQSVRELRQAVQRYAGDFGLTPAAAYRMAGGKAKARESGEDLLDGNWQPSETSEAARVN